MRLSQRELERKTAAIEQRRASIRSVLQAAAVLDPAAECRWISTAWLTGWADSEEAPPPIDNAPLLCEHSNLDPTTVSGMCAASGRLNELNLLMFHWECFNELNLLNYTGNLC